MEEGDLGLDLEVQRAGILRKVLSMDHILMCQEGSMNARTHLLRVLIGFLEEAGVDPLPVLEVKGLPLKGTPGHLPDPLFLLKGVIHLATRIQDLDLDLGHLLMIDPKVALKTGEHRPSAREWTSTRHFALVRSDRLWH